MRLCALALFAALALATPAHAACDVTPIIGAPADARAGANLMITLAVENRGDTNCPGTIEAPAPASYMVDIFLSADRVGPPSWAVYNAAWREDVLLGGGRVSRTYSVGPGVTARYGAPSYEIGPMTLPTGIPPGDYFVCAGVDQGGRVTESNERNNVACNPIRILPTLRIDPRRAPVIQPQPRPSP
jgi:hypothetical protein